MKILNFRMETSLLDVVEGERVEQLSQLPKPIRVSSCEISGGSKKLIRP